MPYKIFRNQVYDKFNGHCAYCGKQIKLKDMQIDHIIPLYRGWADLYLERYNLTRGTNDLPNLNPSCRVCNKWKSTFTIEAFRLEIQAQTERLNLRSSNYRMAKMYGLISETKSEVKFYFETLNK